MIHVSVLIVCFLSTAGTQPAREWLAPERDVKYPYNLERYPLQINTSSETKTRLMVWLYSVDYMEQDELVSYVSVTWPDSEHTSYEFYVAGCSGQSILIDNIPRNQDKTWIISKSDLALSILCNDAHVVEVLYSTSQECAETMQHKVSKIKFAEEDNATDSYLRPPDCEGLPGDWRGPMTVTPQFPVKYGTVVSLQCAVQDEHVFGEKQVTCDGDTYFRYNSSPGPTCKLERQYCEGMQEYSRQYGNYTWPDAYPGMETQIPCRFNDYGGSQGIANATKKCTAVGKEVKHEATDFSTCHTKATKPIDNLVNQTINAANQVEKSEELLEVITNNAGNLDTDNVDKTAFILKKLVELDTLEDKTQGNILRTVDKINNLTEPEQLAKGNTSERVKESILKLANRIAPGGNGAGYRHEKTVAVAVRMANDPDKTTNLVVTSLELGNIANSSFGTEGHLSIFQAEVPHTGPDKRNVTAVIYNTDTFFPAINISTDVRADIRKLYNSSSTKSVEKVASVIADVSYLNTYSSIRLQEPLNITYQLRDHEAVTVNYKIGTTTSVRCAFYDPALKQWSGAGCRTLSASVMTGVWEVRCQCDHMTSFAVLMTFSSNYGLAEEWVSRALLGISLTCLVFTLLAYLPAKELLKTRPVRLNLLLIVSMILSHVTFFVMDILVIMEKKPPYLCETVAFFMNYFWLCQISWMVCEAVVMYRALVSAVLNSHISRYMLKFNVVCWGVPLVFPIIGIAWGQSEYVDPNSCFVKLPYGYVSFYIPLSSAILFNIFLFARITQGLFRSNPQLPIIPTNTRTKWKRQVKFAITTMCLFGVSWVSGFLLIIRQLNTPGLRWLFILTNCTQGTVLFILYVVISESVRKVWIEIFYKAGLREDFTTSLTQFSGKTKVTTTSNDTTASCKEDTQAGPRLRPRQGTVSVAVPVNTISVTISVTSHTPHPAEYTSHQLHNAGSACQSIVEVE